MGLRARVKKEHPTAKLVRKEDPRNITSVCQPTVIISLISDDNNQQVLDGNSIFTILHSLFCFENLYCCRVSSALFAQYNL